MISMDGMPQAGLFSAVSSAFIVNMGSSLSPNSSDTTNSLLKILINKIDNNTFSAQEAALPVWTGPSSMTVWIQTLGYMSLSASLLAAFGAVLAKQWLGHFKTSRFGKGALHERCHRRQQKFDGLNAWNFSSIISALPILLQLSLLFFGIAIAANIWTLQHTVASVIMGTTALGFIFYLFTVVASLKSPDCPFQTPVSILLQKLIILVSTVIWHFLRGTDVSQKVARKKWEGRPTSWASFLDGLRRSSGWILHTAKDKTMQLLTRFVGYISRRLAALGRHKVRWLALDPGAAGGIEQSGATGGVQSGPGAGAEQIASVEELDLSSLESCAEAEVYAVQSSAVQWILETTTDIDVIATAARIIPEIEWPAEDNVIHALDRLQGHFYACFDPARQILPLAQPWALSCLKAISHVSIERDLDNPFFIFTDGVIHTNNAPTKLYDMFPTHDFLVTSCAVNHTVKLDSASLQLSDRMWMARMFTYRLHKGEDDPVFVTFVIEFISTNIYSSKSPARLVADCLLLAGLLLGLPIDRQHLARIDKR
jgi:Family of unknown function (DUF6535)